MTELPSSIAESGYVGWVATLTDGSVLFEAVPRATSAMPGAVTKSRRPEDRNVIDWRDVPHERISRLEVYGFHDHYSEQPLIRLDREPGATDIRYCVLTMAGLAVSTAGRKGVRHIGVSGWRVGWFNPARGEYDIWEIRKSGRRRLAPDGTVLRPDGPPLKGHPCAPRPAGFGIAPHAFGLDGRQVMEGVD